MHLLLLSLVQPDPITRDGAREAAERELSKQIYQEAQPPLFERFLRWLVERIADWWGRMVTAAPGGRTSVVLALILLVLLVVALRLGLGPVRRGDPLADRRRGARAFTPEDYRAEADRLAGSGEWKEALRARFRAVIRELEQRGVLDPRPGRTAGEIAREAGAAVPSVAGSLTDAAQLFNAVWYGGRPAGPDEYSRMRAVDESVRAARLAVTGS